MQLTNVLPQSIEAEEAILGACMIDPNAISLIKGKLKAEHFSLEGHRAIYGAILYISNQGMFSDAIQVQQFLSDCNRLEKVGGLGKLINLVNSVVSAHGIESYADLVIDKFLRRKLIDASVKMRELFADAELQLIDAIQKAEALIFEVRECMGRGGSALAQPISEILPQVADELEKANRGQEADSGTIATGITDLDNLTGGLVKAAPTFIAGRPGMGKTQVGIELSLRVATAGKPVLYFSLEMKREQMTRRILSRLSADPTTAQGVNPNAIDVVKFFQRNKMTPKDWDTFYELVPVAADIPIFIQDKANATISEIASEARRIKSAFGELGLIVVDYVQLMRFDNSGKVNRIQELDIILSGLREIAKDFDCPLIGIAQLNRQAEGRAEKQPKLSDFRESGGFEQEGALIIGLYRDEYYNKDSEKQGILEMEILKSRFSPTGKIDVLFKPEYGWIANLKK